jgi:hypothetical protein
VNWERSEGFENWPGCLGCAHLRRGGRSHCTAYPDGIPFVIEAGEIDHLVARPGQIGSTVFEPLDLQHWLKTKERRVLAEPSQPPETVGRHGEDRRRTAGTSR